MASSSDLNVVVDVVIPVGFVIAIFVINGFVLRFIMRKRREYQDLPQQLEAADAAAAEKPTTSAAATVASAELQGVPVVAVAENDNDSCSIEMERL